MRWLKGGCNTYVLHTGTYKVVLMRSLCTVWEDDKVIIRFHVHSQTRKLEECTNRLTVLGFLTKESAIRMTRGEINQQLDNVRKGVMETLIKDDGQGKVKHNTEFFIQTIYNTRKMIWDCDIPRGYYVLYGSGEGRVYGMLGPFESRDVAMLKGIKAAQYREGKKHQIRVLGFMHKYNRMVPVMCDDRNYYYVPIVEKDDERRIAESYPDANNILIIENEKTLVEFMEQYGYSVVWQTTLKEIE